MTTTSTSFSERRELDQRTSDGIEVTLFWTRSSDQVTIAILDTRCGETVEFEVDGRSAFDAFQHPYAYAAAATVARHAAGPRVAHGVVA
jgi:hypothetical protein